MTAQADRLTLALISPRSNEDYGKYLLLMDDLPQLQGRSPRSILTSREPRPVRCPCRGLCDGWKTSAACDIDEKRKMLDCH